MDDMDVEKIIREYLVKNGYDGLYLDFDESDVKPCCFCRHDDTTFLSCPTMPTPSECRPWRKRIKQVSGEDES
jgi:hypothetical protein